MSVESKRSVIYEPQCLHPLVEKTELLTTRPNGRVAVVDKLPVILDENGVPRRVAMIRQALSAIAFDHEWTGAYDVHHMAHDGRQYRAIVDGAMAIGSMYRGSGLLKVYLPRQLHEFMHAVYDEPPVPDIDVMRQFAVESDVVHNLYNTVRVDSFRNQPEIDKLSFHRKERYRKESLLRKLDRLPDSQIGVLPDRSTLAEARLRESRKLLRRLACATGFSNVPNCQRVFFESENVAV